MEASWRAKWALPKRTSYSCTSHARMYMSVAGWTAPTKTNAARVTLLKRSRSSHIQTLCPEDVREPWTRPIPWHS